MTDSNVLFGKGHGVCVHLCDMLLDISLAPTGGGGGISHTAEKPRQYKLAWIGNQLMQPGKVNMDKARSAYTTYSCTAVIRESVWNIKDNKSVLMTGFPYLKDRETPYVKTWGDFWKTPT